MSVQHSTVLGNNGITQYDILVQRLKASGANIIQHTANSFLLITVSKTKPYLFTAWCRVLFEKLNGLQLVNRFPAFHGTRWFITALTSVRHLSLSWASPIQSIYPHPTSWRSILILSTHLTKPNLKKHKIYDLSAKACYRPLEITFGTGLSHQAVFVALQSDLTLVSA